MGRRRIGRRYFLLLLAAIVLTCLILLLMTGCELENPLMNDIKELVYPHIVFTISDKDTGAPITDATLIVVETDYIQDLTSDTHDIFLEPGNYNVYLKSPGYRVKGYVLNLHQNTQINVRLKKLESFNVTQGNVSGTVTKEGADLGGPFYISRGTVNVHNIPEEFLTGPDFTVSAPCGDIAVAAFTKDANQAVEKVVYDKKLLTQYGLVGLILDFIATGAKTFDGQKPGSDSFRVKLNEGYILAEQSTTASTYSFAINLLSGDGVTLESVKYDEADTYFTRKNVGSSGGENNIVYDVGLPTIAGNSSTDYYIVSFNAGSGASFHELYVLEIVGGEPNIPFQAAILTKAEIKIPKLVVNPAATEVNIYLSAVKMAGFNQAKLLAGTMSYDQYSYSETGKIVTDSIKSSPGIKQFSSIVEEAPLINYRQAYGFDFLIMEE